MEGKCISFDLRDFGFYSPLKACGLRKGETTCEQVEIGQVLKVANFRCSLHSNKSFNCPCRSKQEHRMNYNKWYLFETDNSCIFLHPQTNAAQVETGSCPAVDTSNFEEPSRTFSVQGKTARNVTLEGLNMLRYYGLMFQLHNHTAKKAVATTVVMMRILMLTTVVMMKILMMTTVVMMRILTATKAMKTGKSAFGLLLLRRLV